MLRTYVVRHGIGFRYKRRIAPDLQSLVGRSAWVVWLGSDKDAADRAALQLTAEHDALLARYRRLGPADRKRIVEHGGPDALRRAVQDAVGAPFVEAGAIYTSPLDMDTRQEQADAALQAVEDRAAGRPDARRRRGRAAPACPRRRQARP